jgi:hypothetical protein
LSGSDNSHSHNPSRDINKGWKLDAHYVPPQVGARIISIKAQPPLLQTVIRAAIREVTGDALFVTSYPSAATVVDYYHGILKKSAENPNLSLLHDRFQRDPKFAAVVSRVVRFSRLSCLSRDPLSLFTVSCSSFKPSLWPKEDSDVRGKRFLSADPW